MSKDFLIHVFLSSESCCSAIPHPKTCIVFYFCQLFLYFLLVSHGITHKTTVEYVWRIQQQNGGTSENKSLNFDTFSFDPGEIFSQFQFVQLQISYVRNSVFDGQNGCSVQIYMKYQLLPICALDILELPLASNRMEMCLFVYVCICMIKKIKVQN